MRIVTIRETISAVEEVSCHEQLQGDLRGDGELRDLGGGVGVPGGTTVIQC